MNHYNYLDNANNECISYSDGTNILNCKTEKEWKEVGISYCKSGGLSMHTAQVDTYQR